jgi:zinc protease
MQEKEDPYGLATRAFVRELYGSGHPYSQPQSGLGTEATVKAISRDDILSFYRTNYVPNNAGIVVVGDITLEEAKAKLEKVFAAWKPGAAQAAAVPDPMLPAKTQIVIVDKPGSAQSMIVAGSVGLKRSSPDWMNSAVMMNALGGQFISRVNMNLREQKGITYGAFTFFTAHCGVGASMSYAPVQTPSTKEGVEELVKEIKEIGSTRPLAGDELKVNQEQIIKGFQSNFENIGSIAASLASIIAYNLPEDSWKTFDGRVRAVDATKALDAASRYLHPDKLLIVVCGDKEKIEPELKALNLGEVTSIDPATL